MVIQIPPNWIFLTLKSPFCRHRVLFTFHILIACPGKRREGRGVHFSVWPSGGRGGGNMAKLHVGEIIWLKRDEKGGENSYFFPQFVNILHIFPPFYLKHTKLKKKRLEIFILIFIWGKNMNQEGDLNFKFNIHPWGRVLVLGCFHWFWNCYTTRGSMSVHIITLYNF